MTPHDHDTYVEGCYRCELSRHEAEIMARFDADPDVQRRRIKAFGRKRSPKELEQITRMLNEAEPAPVDPKRAL